MARYNKVIDQLSRLIIDFKIYIRGYITEKKLR